MLNYKATTTKSTQVPALYLRRLFSSQGFTFSSFDGRLNKTDLSETNFDRKWRLLITSRRALKDKLREKRSSLIK
jgi:hypothetical protein